MYRIKKHFFIVLNFILAVALVYMISYQFYQKNMGQEDAENNARANQLVTKKEVKKTNSSSKPYSHGKKIIGRRNLFKVRVDGSRPQPVPQKSQEYERGKIKITKLKLDLKGTVTGGSVIWAVIEDKKKRGQFLYKAGDSIGPAKVQAVYKNYVVLVQDGQESRLDMSNEASTFTGAGEPDDSENRSVRMSETFKQGINYNDIGRRASGKDRIKTRPYYIKGKSKGFLLYGIRGSSIYRKIGLRNGDVLVKVNDDVVENQENALDALAQLKSSNTMELTILRQGKEKIVLNRINNP